MAREGLKLERFIGPQTAHRYHPETKAALTQRLEELIARGRDPEPREVRLSTYTLRYPESAWVRIEGMHQQWERAEVRAVIKNPKLIEAHTKNVTALWFQQLRPSQGFTGKIVVDGDTLEFRAPVDIPLVLVKEKRWMIQKGADYFSRPRKRTGLSGPIDDAFMDAFLFVQPTGKPLNATVGAWVDGELAAARQLWHDVFRADVRVKLDRDVTVDDIATHNLILWGDPSSNRLLTRMLRQLPLQWTAEKLIFREATYDASHHAPILVLPNPLNSGRYVVLNSGIDFRADGYGNNALQTPKLPDWAVVDLSTPPDSRWPGKIVKAGFFDEEWK
jgi:hypothetical protein